MKFCAAVAVVLLAGNADAMSIRGNSQSAQTLMQKARRLQNNQYQQYYSNNRYGQNGQYWQGQNGQGQYWQGQNGQYWQGQNGQGQNGQYYYGQNGQEQNGQAQNGQNIYMEMEDDMMWFMASYSIKLLTCIAGEQVVNYQDNGEAKSESSTVVFRLCPSDTCTGNTNITQMGCDSGYGDYAVGINSFLQAYLESQKEVYGEEMIYYNAMGEEFSVNEYSECAGYNMEENQGQGYYNGYYQNGEYQQYQYNGDGNAYENQYYGNDADNADNGGRKLQDNNYNQWYIGPGCTDDGKDIKFGLYRDQYCTYSPGTKMSDINYAWQNGMPYEDGGLITSGCQACLTRDQDYNAKISPMCADSFRSATARCETNMASISYFGANVNGCDYVATLEQSIYGDAIYGNMTNDTLANTTASAAQANETLEEAAMRWMDSLNTRQNRAFIAGIVLFCLSFCISCTLASCMCYRKRRARKRAKALVANKDVYGGVADPTPEIKPKVSMVDLVRTSSKRVTEAVAAAAIGTQVAIKTAASGALAAVTRSSSKKKVEIEESEYTNMEDDIEKMPTSENSYKAPAAADVASVRSAVASVKSSKSKRSFASVKPTSSMKSSKSIPATISTPKPATEAEEEKPSELYKPAAQSSGNVLEWLGMSGGSTKGAEKVEASEDADESEANEQASAATPSVSSTNDESSKKDLTTQMSDYFNQKFT